MSLTWGGGLCVCEQLVKMWYATVFETGKKGERIIDYQNPLK